MSSANQLAWIVIIASLLFGFASMTFIYYYLKHHTLIVRDKLNEKTQVKTLWVTEKVDKKTGIVWWKTIPFHQKIMLPRPPSSCLDVNPKGRFVAEVHRISEDEFVYIKDRGINIIEENVKGKKVLKIAEVQVDGSHKIIDTFQPFTAVQRDILINQYEKANKLGSDRWTKNDVMNIALFTLMAMIIVVAIVFSGDILKGINQIQDSTNSGITEATKLVQSVRSIDNGLRPSSVVESENSNSEIVEGSEIPPTI